MDVNEYSSTWSSRRDFNCLLNGMDAKRLFPWSCYEMLDGCYIDEYNLLFKWIVGYSGYDPRQIDANFSVSCIRPYYFIVYVYIIVYIARHMPRSNFLNWSS